MSAAKIPNYRAALTLQGADGNFFVAGKLAPKRRERRWLIVSTHKAHPHLSSNKLGAKLKADPKTVKHWLDIYERTGDVQDQHRSGRKKALTGSAIKQFKQVVAEQEGPVLTSSRTCAQLLQSALGVMVSARTVRRTLGTAGWKHGHGKKVIQISPNQKLKRLKFAQKHLSLRTKFSKWMFTDSKIFQLRRTSAKPGLKVWYSPEARPTVPVVKHSQGLHVYVGVTKYGATKLLFVTGGGGRKSTHINPKTGQPHAGVSAAEYQEQVLPSLIKDGQDIFAQRSRWGSEWVFQQDGAKPHTAKTTKAMLDVELGGRVVNDWPPSSPDLSWVENIWSWAERQLHTHHPNLQSLAELEAALVQVFDTVPKEMLKNYVRGMPERLRRCVALGGDLID